MVSVLPHFKIFQIKGRDVDPALLDMKKIQTSFDVFTGYRSGTLIENGLMLCIAVKSFNQ